MPESWRDAVKLDRHQKTPMNALRCSRHAASHPLLAEAVLQSEPGIFRKAFRAHQQRPAIVHIRGVYLNYFRLAWNTDVKFHRDAQHHALAVPSLIVRR